MALGTLSILAGVPRASWLRIVVLVVATNRVVLEDLVQAISGLNDPLAEANTRAFPTCALHLLIDRDILSGRVHRLSSDRIRQR